MSNNIVLHSLNQIASFLKVPPGKITLDTYSVPIRSFNNIVTKGYTTIVLQLVKEQNTTAFTINNVLDKAELGQWLEYAVVYALYTDNSTQNANQILKELNDVLSIKTYLVASKLTVADVVLYYILFNTIANLSYLDKERYLNLSRWYDNLQQNAAVRQHNRIINFNTNYLATIVPSKH